MLSVWLPRRPFGRGAGAVYAGQVARIANRSDPDQTTGWAGRRTAGRNCQAVDVSVLAPPACELLYFCLQHRFSKGFTLLTNYTWSHCVSEVDFTGELAGSQYQNPFDRHANRGNCNFDVRHNFNTSLVATAPAVGGKL